MRVFSYGGGVQSTAALALAAQREIDFGAFIFANTGDDSEHPETLKYVREIAMPYAKEHGIELHEMQKTRFGEPETLHGRLIRDDTSIGIPVRMSNGAPGRRACTYDFKVNVIAKWLRAHGATSTAPATVGLGISLDEFSRMRSVSGFDFYGLEYPLIDLRLDRAQCQGIISRADLPVPPKSACWFCPFHSKRKWQEMRTNEPELFWKSVELERQMNERRARHGKDEVWFTDGLRPLDQVTSDMVQDEMFTESETACDSGYCFT